MAWGFSLLLYVDGADDLTATGIVTGAPTVGAPALGQTHSLTATGIATGAPAVGAPSLGQTHALTTTGIVTGAPTVGAPALTSGGTTHNLTATGIVTGAPTVGSPSLTSAAARRRGGGRIYKTPERPQAKRPLTQAEVDRLVDDILAKSRQPRPPAAPRLPAVLTALVGKAPSAAPVSIRRAPVVVHALQAIGIATGPPTLGTPALAHIDDDEVFMLLDLVA